MTEHDCIALADRLNAGCQCVSLDPMTPEDFTAEDAEGTEEDQDCVEMGHSPDDGSPERFRAIDVLPFPGVSASSASSAVKMFFPK